jgi:hypothetical protein
MSDTINKTILSKLDIKKTNIYGEYRRVKISIDPTKVGGSLTNYPLYINLGLLNDNFWDYVKNGGGDIRIFSQDNTTELPREIVSCDTTAKTGEVYALVPLVSSLVATKIYLYFSNNNLSDYAVDDTYGAQNVWGNNAKYIGHFEGNADDSSVNNKNGTVSGASQVDGKLGGKAYSFDGLNNKITIGSGNNDYDNGLVIAVWLKNYKQDISSISYQCEDDLGAEVGAVSGNYWKGRQGIDAAGGKLVDYVIPNTDFGSRTIAIYGYQTNPDVVSGTFLIKDETTGQTLGSGDLGRRVITDSDKRMNSLYIFEGKGHPFHVYIYFSDNTDVYLDYISTLKAGYDGVVQKGNNGNPFGINLNNSSGYLRGYLNGNGNVSGSGSGYIPDTFVRLVVVYNKSEIKYYQDGVYKDHSTNVTGNLTQSTSDIILGDWGGYSLWGELDEVYLRDDPENWTQAYITTDYNNQNSPATFYSFIYQTLSTGISAKSRIQIANITKTLSAKSHLLVSGNDKSISSKTDIKLLDVLRSIQSKSAIQRTFEKTISSKCRIQRIEVTSIQSKTNIEKLGRIILISSKLDVKKTTSQGRFPYEVSVSIDHTKVAGDLIDYPLYIDLSKFDNLFWSRVKNGGGDIRIFASDKQTELPREIVSCDTSSKTGEVHTKLSSLSSSENTIIYVCFGNSIDNDYLATDTYGSQAVWGSTSKIYHLKDLTSLTVLDSKGNYNGSKTATHTPLEVNGKIGSGQSFDGESNYASINIDQAAIDPSKPHTFVAWVKIKSTPNSNNNGIVDKFEMQTGGFSCGSTMGISISRTPYIRIGTAAVGSGFNREQTLYADSNLSTGTFYFVAGIYDGTNLRFQLNRTSKSTGATYPPVDRTSTNTRIGNTHHSNGTIDGIIDEVRIYQEALSTQRLTTDYNNQSSPETFYEIGETRETSLYTKARIEKAGVIKTVSSKTNIRSSIGIKTVSSKCSIKNVKAVIISGKARIEKTFSSSISAKVNLKATESKEIFAKARILVGGVVASVLSKLNIKQTKNISVSSKLSIHRLTERSIASKTRINRIESYSIQSRANIRSAVPQNILSKLAIYNFVNRSIQSKLSIKIFGVTKTISCKADIYQPARSLEMPMRLLNTKIDIKRKTITKDAIGDSTEVFNIIQADVPGTIQTLTGQEIASLQGEVYNYTHRGFLPKIVIRAGTHEEVSIREGDFLLDKETLVSYRIKNIEEMRPTNRLLNNDRFSHFEVYLEKINDERYG